MLAAVVAVPGTNRFRTGARRGQPGSEESMLPEKAQAC